MASTLDLMPIAVLTMNDGLCFGFAHGLGRRSIVAALVKELVCDSWTSTAAVSASVSDLEDRDAAWL